MNMLGAPKYTVKNSSKRIFRKRRLFPLLDKFLLKGFLYPNDASKLVSIAGNVEGEVSKQRPLLEYKVGLHIII
jgi:hypothetical protein